ncbi:sigma-70 family RNA polymerase sigma factor [Solitalea longa]|uniref:Sigma-70 family RNA polymerase sigma factor n=1 Tax=Solitalea longa TaxID=2079460 RepID=A0A2S5A3P1_9SPHI|nr:sigma-70 family RNA polymerase sigma factor [Solitalea longa]POY36932.1 sigma-70 family RNA polymerase sigma factor [Solitalea longa]
MTDEQLSLLIEGCMRNDRQSQKMLYQAFYGFAMGICLRYATNRYEAAEVVNEGFFKLFTNIGRYDSSRSFKSWLSSIMHNASIDFYRANIKRNLTDDLESAPEIEVNATIEQKLAYDDLLAIVQKLPPAYRAVFNLYAIDGYSHEEIAQMLHISSGTSKSNLFKARAKLQKMIIDKQNGTEVREKLIVNINQSGG